MPDDAAGHVVTETRLRDKRSASVLEAPIRKLEVAAYTVPTDTPEADGTLTWDSTTMVVVHAHAGDACGIGYTYSHQSAAELVRDQLAGVVVGRDAMAPAAAWWAMRRSMRNAGVRGVVMRAISAIDVALWDLKARLLRVPLATLLGVVHESVPAYASGGFTSYDERTLCRTMADRITDGFQSVKMKVGADSSQDATRVAAARRTIGDEAELFVDANGAYSVAQAVEFANLFAREGVTWFEEPCSGDDVKGLALIRTRSPGGLAIAAGEYAEVEDDFIRLLEHEAVDVAQPDVTRCGGVTGALRATTLCAAHHVGVSTHGAPALALPVACACPEIRHIEYFFDHARIESRLFDGAPRPKAGRVTPDLTRIGHGLELKQRDAERFQS